MSGKTPKSPCTHGTSFKCTIKALSPRGSVLSAKSSSENLSLKSTKSSTPDSVSKKSPNEASTAKAVSPARLDAQLEGSAKESTAQLRSALAIGQLIASNRPTAGSRLIACELRQFSKTLKEESAALRKEVAGLSVSLANSLKTVLEDEREQRNMSAASAFARRPLFGLTPPRRNFPVYRRPRRMQLQFARKTTNASTNTPSPGASISRSPISSSSSSLSAPSSSLPASKLPQLTASPSSRAAIKDGQPSQRIAQKESSTASKLSTSAAKALEMLLKNSWPNNDVSSYDGEADSNSTDTTPSSSP